MRAVARCLGKNLRQSLHTIVTQTLESFVSTEKREIADRVTNLISFNKSFFIESNTAETSYTFIFSNSFSDFVAQLEFLFALENELGLFGGLEDVSELNSFYYEARTIVSDYISFVFEWFSKFFEVNISEFINSHKKMFIMIDNPYQKKQIPNKIERPEMNKLEVFVWEFAQILRAAQSAPHHYRELLHRHFASKGKSDTSIQSIVSQNELLNILLITQIEKSSELKSLLEILMKLYLSLAVRENLYLRYIFYSAKESQCVHDLTREILKCSFGLTGEKFKEGIFNSQKSTTELVLKHENLNFVMSCEWVHSIFAFLETVCINAVWSMEKNSAISTLSFAFNTLINNDVKNLMAKLGEMAIRRELFNAEGFSFEDNSVLFGLDSSRLKAMIKEQSEEKKAKRDSKRLFNGHNLMFAVLINLFDVICFLAGKLKEHLSAEISKLQSPLNETEVFRTCVEDLEVASRDFSNKKKSLLGYYVECLMEDFCSINFDKLRSANLGVIRHSEIHYVDPMIDKLAKNYEIFGVYLNEENLANLKSVSSHVILRKFRDLILTKTYNFQGSIVVKQEFEKLKNFCLESCEFMDEINQLNLIIELLTSIDRDYFDNFVNYSRGDLSETTIEQIRKSRVDLG